jgi:hypothetical protein
METPNFQHDCNSCHFLGRYVCAEKKEADLYFCLQNGLPTVIARFSNDGPDYISGFYSIEYEPALKEAYMRAVKAGFISSNKVLEKPIYDEISCDNYDWDLVK